MKKYVLITGSGGLIGSDSVEFFIKKKFYIIGIENNYRKFFFGKDGSITKRNNYLLKNYKNYICNNFNLKNLNLTKNLFKNYKSKIKIIIHSAAQPSHDWAIKNPLLDFDINARSTLNLLECFKNYCPEAKFIYLSTNKVYGDNPNKLNFYENKYRYDVKKNSSHYNGINEKFSIDNNIHSLFGASKLSADIYVQEYGKNFNLNTVCFRGGCLTGENHSGAELHGFLSYLVKCSILKKKYKIIGYKGKQVRDNIHSSDLINCFWEYCKNPKKGEVYNIGGGRQNSCSIIEILNMIEKKLKLKIKTKIIKKNRVGDHQWWITDFSKFKKDYPNWKIKKNLETIIDEMIYNYKKEF